jgi:uncharacterized membrane protein YqiK
MMEKAIALYQKSLEQSAAQAEADVARARAAEAEERVTTVRESEAAKRRRTVDVELAEKAAQEQRIAAEAERIRATVEAEAQKLLNEAENVLTDSARFSLFRRKLLDRVEGIVAASVKPMEKIQDIRIMQLGGLGNGGGGSDAHRNATDEIIDSALRYRVQAPLIDNLLADLGIEGGTLSKMGGLVREARDMAAIAKETGSAPPKAAPPNTEPSDGGSDKPSGSGRSSGRGRGK